MACKAVNLWTFSGLVGAFLDLGIAFLLLCASTLAYFASKFLGLLGLCLPCPCNGLFGNPNSSSCLHRVSVDCPLERISSVQFSAKSKFPFDLILAEDPNCYCNAELMNERNNENEHVELEDHEASCSSLLVGTNDAGFEFDLVNSPTVKEGRSGLKGNGVVGQRQRQRQRHDLRKRRKGKAVDHGKFLSVSSYDGFCLDAGNVSQSPSSVYKMGIEITEKGSSVPVNSGGGWEAPVDNGLQESVSHGFELIESPDEDKSAKKGALSERLRCNVQGELGFDGNETNIVRVLEQALQEEHAARTSLYVELEKERSAAASAADEAMAMILRLQEEKGSIEMEARQYHRMIEEKSAYDAEEMNILKEILLRREKEKHFLEKEVEACRQVMFDTDLLDVYLQDMAATQVQETSLLYSSEDEKVKSCRDSEVPYIELQNRTLAFGKELPKPESDEDADFLEQGDIHWHPRTCKHPRSSSGADFQEKGILSMDEDAVAQRRELHTIEAVSQLNQSSTSKGFNLHEGTIDQVGEEHEQSDSTSVCQRLATKTIEFCNEDKIVTSYNGDDVEKCGKDANQGNKVSHTAVFDTEPRVHDVHVIDDESTVCNEVSVKNREQLLSRPETGLVSDRSRSDITSGLPPKVPLRSKTLVSDIRRNSMSAIDLRRNSMSAIDLRRNSMSSMDNERLKIDNEIERLQERLRIVQEGREKLNISLGHKERENTQLQLLEDIASQLREIRQLTEPGKAVREASLPLPSSMVMSKKRRCRSASSGVHRST